VETTVGQAMGRATPEIASAGFLEDFWRVASHPSFMRCQAGSAVTAGGLELVEYRLQSAHPWRLRVASVSPMVRFSSAARALLGVGRVNCHNLVDIDRLSITIDRVTQRSRFK